MSTAVSPTLKKQGTEGVWLTSASPVTSSSSPTLPRTIPSTSPSSPYATPSARAATTTGSTGYQPPPTASSSALAVNTNLAIGGTGKADFSPHSFETADEHIIGGLRPSSSGSAANVIVLPTQTNSSATVGAGTAFKSGPPFSVGKDTIGAIRAMDSPRLLDNASGELGGSASSNNAASSSAAAAASYGAGGSGTSGNDSMENRPSFQSRRSSAEVRGDGRPSVSLDALERIKLDTSNAQNTGSSNSSNSKTSAGGITNGAPANHGPNSPYPSSAISPSMSGFSTTATTLPEEVVPTGFDEGTLRTLCDLDCAMPLLYDRIKQSMVSAREAASFLKKRAQIEEEYARSLSKLARTSAESYSNNEGKAGTYVNSWMSLMKVHDQLADSRLRFAGKIGEISEELTNLSKEVDKQRRFAKETGQKLEKSLTEAEQSVEKARGRFDNSAEDLERLLLIKQGESTKGGELTNTSVGGVAGAIGGTGRRTLGKAMGKTGLLFKQKNPQQMLRQEEEIRVRTSNASDAFRKEVHQTQQMRTEFFNMQLPRILRSLKESSEEIDNGTQYHLTRYAFLFESLVLSDGMAISPINSPDSNTGLKGCIEIVDNRADFKVFMQNYQMVHGRDYKGPRRDGQYDDGFMPPSPSTISKALAPQAPSLRPIFGVDLATQMARDNVEVPPILEKCSAAIEAIGIQSMGIYRLSGTTSKVQRLKNKFDQDWSAIDLMNDEAINDINIVAGCLKLWFRELPEPLLTHELYQGFIEAAKISNYRLRHIRLHERVNELPDPNYATLKALMRHLDAIRSQEASNQMGASNLAIVFGPTLLSPPIPASTDANGAAAGALHLQDMSFQCKAIETILEKYKEIFVEEAEE